ncbi:MAG: FeoB-associated Cys-rich membrane protein [Bacilli bacterium]|jgi:hypothetical protein|nr:FeoB-associated Cys-rich membrane protein [Bacilli bacterium]MDD3389186.1 FeoB-associated Cys-rich membrane protein [Bacilli bacterium]MDD4344973.1 FeoB-associated Cys-rich membrane protein [Bacilli bacterium]MDD4521150.1 FeoB-associated Cys-rich membrane protein [Bacilli bacterium]MDY0399917.1 FeoB-associated Cys-rich membrane protein [Bacilli bacterium]
MQIYEIIIQIIVAVLTISFVVAVIIFSIRRTKRGETSCGGNCQSCSQKSCQIFKQEFANYQAQKTATTNKK